MAINTSSFSTESVSRNEPLTSSVPPTIPVYFVDKIPPLAFTSQRRLTWPYDISYTTVPNDPLFAGQVCVYYDQANNSYPSMYIVVNINGTLKWKQVMLAYAINSSTGQAWDPLASFYNPLAQ